ncbi:SixA phosphatase family protein [Flavimaricola marinus]|uniref:2,3-bisphosphoglycerate-dependent phosphoglycerate mutase n=1 Tax=Flavimaricola marinus TaxID=1819565 RepID=A0A238L9P5_9RHOB|nr:histidine phosphatase family protein [Flavimaricola marinus]SMY06388.1 2,3-bisphosphoglycerate-dependent phosphoglycerate mutase [Flavimaricola marinus]
MTLKLILVRHAKSSWDNPFGDDHQRVLNERGRRTAPQMGRWLQSLGHVPDQVLCSDAARTAETLALMLSEWDHKPQITYLHKLYHAAPFTILDTLQQATGRCVAMFGHNPGIGGMASGIVRVRPQHERYSDYPTCAVAVITFDTDKWSEVGPGSGTCIDFAIPGDLHS